MLQCLTFEMHIIISRSVDLFVRSWFSSVVHGPTNELKAILTGTGRQLYRRSHSSKKIIALSSISSKKRKTTNTTTMPMSTCL